VSLDSAETRSGPEFVNRPMFLGPEACGLAVDRRPGWDLGESLVQDDIAYVTAHEVGHVLGLLHNMAASTYPGSVMDYLPAYVRVEGGLVATKEAYPASIGTYDEMAVRWAYTPRLTPTDLDALVQEGLGRGLAFPQSDDARWATWDLGPDALEYLECRMALRRVLLSELAQNGARYGEPVRQLYHR